MKLYLLGLPVLFLVSMAHADSTYICDDAQNTLQSTITVNGSGSSAKVHVEDASLSADLIVSAQAGMPGYATIAGTITNKTTTPPSQFSGAYFIEPGLLNGAATGNFKRFTGDGFQTSVCTKSIN